VIAVWYISHACGLNAPSSAYPCPAANAPRTEIRAAVATEFASSSPRRIAPCTALPIAAASAPARKSSPACTMAIASPALAGAGAVTVLMPGHLHSGAHGALLLVLTVLLSGANH
jgi:hypothetical protein